MKVTSTGLEVVLKGGPRGKERLKIKNQYPNTPLSRFLFSQLGLMHLVAAYFPRAIQVEFGIPKQIADLISAMYKSEKHKPPVINHGRRVRNKKFRCVRVSKDRVVVAYSAGKDSMGNLWWAQEKY